IELGRRRAAQADLELVLIPADSQEVTGGALGPRQLRVVSKGDLLAGSADGSLVTSVKSGEGLEALKDAIIAAAVPAAAEGDDGVVVTSERQRKILEDARACFVKVSELAGSAPPEVVAVEARSGNARLAEFLGDEVGDEVLDELFARFCIGK
ncbi:unnamed protein product, partial [marine sediment metagenome]